MNHTPQAGPRREPAINAPFLAVATALSMPILYMAQSRLPDHGLAWAFYPVRMGEGEWTGLFTSMLLHGGWTHVMMNAIGALTFGAPAARLFRGGVGVLAFLILYIGGGVLAAAGYGLVHPNGEIPVVGASGAVFALIGASTRLYGRIAAVRPLLDRQALTMAAAWMGVNLLVGLIGYAPGAQGAGIAWEAHAFGFVFGYLSIGALAGPFVGGRFARPPHVSDPDG